MTGKKVHKAMEMVHALDFKDRDFTEISDGQRHEDSAGQSNLPGTRSDCSR